MGLTASLNDRAAALKHFFIVLPQDLLKKLKWQLILL